jgi:hypothetical protein
MPAGRYITGILTILLVFSPPSYGQGETAVPFLLITSSPEGNGMGGISGSVPTNSALALLANPGQLGFLTLDNYFAGAAYTRKTPWLWDLTYNCSATAIGINFSRLADIPVSISLGVGYGQVDLDLGRFTVTGPSGPEPIAYFDAYEKAKAYSVGVGVEYLARFGVGYTSKRVLSLRGELNPSDSTQAKAEPHMTDFGLILQVPVAKIISELRGSGITVFPNTGLLVDIMASYSRANVGGTVSYIDQAQADPLPRKAAIGLCAEFGLTSKAVSSDWKIVSLLIAREVEDILVRRFHDGSFEYTTRFGDIRFFRNLILGEWGGEVTLRKGWQINLAEILYIRGGSVVQPGLQHATSGFSVRLGGTLKLIQSLSPRTSEAPVFSFFANHIDIQYDQSSYGQTDSPIAGTDFKGLSLVLK